MLGLLSHDPHFCLLREEVTFGRKTKKATGLAHTNFFLLHLSLLREYIDLEFTSIAHEIPFKYDLERIIDDFILMGIFVGNDFLPHLPDFHINEGALERTWSTYKRILPAVGGYLNEFGTISLERLQVLLDELAKFELDHFEHEYADLGVAKGRMEKEAQAIEKAKQRGQMVISKSQQKIVTLVRGFVLENKKKPSSAARLELVNSFSPADQAFLKNLAESLHLVVRWDETDDYGQSLAVLTFDLEGVSDDEVDSTPDEERDGEDEWQDEADAEEEADEGELAIERVLNKYAKAKVVEQPLDEYEQDHEEKLKAQFEEWKRTYYKSKLEISYDDPTQLGQLVYRYVEGLQWILNYYYKGVPSWSWYYDYHYSPRITDLTGLAELKFNFDKGKPFTPFQQLMGVLPEESKEHVPSAYRDLMYEETSPIIDFYPTDFELDMNGKKQDWEAVVKIPFIDQERLLRAMASRDARLTPEEKERNKGDRLATAFVYDPSKEDNYPSSHPGFFPDIFQSHCRSEDFVPPKLGDGVELITGLIEGVQIGAKALAGFPSLYTLPHTGHLEYHGVNVFQSDSRNQSMVITITAKHDKADASAIAKKSIGQRTFHSWPYLQEGLVVGVSDDMYKYELQQSPRGGATVVSTPHNHFQTIAFKKDCDKHEHQQSKRFGVIIGHTEVLLHIRPLKGLKRMDTGAFVKDYENDTAEITQAWQTIVTQVAFEDERFIEQGAPPVSSEFPDGERIIFLGGMAYGTAGQVVSTTDTTLDIALAWFPLEAKENEEFKRVVARRPEGTYYPSPILARRIGISGLALSRITSSLLVQLSDGSKVNIGLALKYESKGLKVLGYSRRNDRGWEFSETTAQALTKYKAAFPEPFRRLDNRGDSIVTSAELCPTSDEPDKVIKAMKAWLKENNLNDLDTVSLFAEQLEKPTVQLIEQLADHFRATKTPDAIKRAAVKGIPRQAVLKPSHAIYRLQGQHFSLGDRVIMVVDAAAGGVPLAMKGVVIGIGSRDIDVVWDVPFMGGETLSGRCQAYRGSTVPFTSCLNLTRPQYVVGPQAQPQAVGQQAPFQPKLGPQPAVPMKNYRPAIPAKNPPTHQAQGQKQPSILRNPARGGAGANGGPMDFGGAAKGTRAQTQAQVPAQSNHRDALATLLTGHAVDTTALAAQQAARIHGGPSRVPQHAQGQAQAHGHTVHVARVGRAPHHPHQHPGAQGHPHPHPHAHGQHNPQSGQAAQNGQNGEGGGRGRGSHRGRGGRGRGNTRGRGRGGNANASCNASTTAA